MENSMPGPLSSFPPRSTSPRLTVSLLTLFTFRKVHKISIMCFPNVNFPMMRIGCKHPNSHKPITVLHTFRGGERCHRQLLGLGGAGGNPSRRAREDSPRRTPGAGTHRCHLYGSLGDQATIGWPLFHSSISTISIYDWRH